MGFDFDRLPPGYRLGCNAAALRVETKCDGLTSMDHNFIKNSKQQIRDFRGDKFLIISPANDPGHGCDGDKVEDAIYLRRSRHEGITEPPDIGGRSSGYGALNILVARGAARIILLGIDMGVGSQSHWHGGYHWDGPMADRLYCGWAEDFNNSLGEINRRGIIVINAIGNPVSRVTAFPTATLEEICQPQL